MMSDEDGVVVATVLWMVQFSIRKVRFISSLGNLVEIAIV